jgi:hypothetical protein
MGSCRLLAPPPQNRNSPCGMPNTPAMPCSSLFWRYLRQKCPGVNAAPLAQRSTAAEKALRPSILRSSRKMPIRNCHPPLRCAPRSVDLNIISRSSATPRKTEGEGNDDRSKRGGRRISETALSAARLQASGRLVYSKSFHRPASQFSSVQLSRSNRQIRFKAREEYHTILSPEISSYPRNQDEYEMRPGNRGTHYEAAAASSNCGTWGTARQRPGRVVVRHFCDWSCCYNACRLSPRHLSLRRRCCEGR